MSISFDNPIAVETAAPPPFFFFTTQRTYSFWRCLWPFRTITQAITMLALTAVVVIICGVVLRESLDLRVRLLVFFCFIITLVRELREQLPGKITIATSRGSAHQLIPDLKHAILELGYTDTLPSPKGERLQFRPKSNARLSFLSPRQNVELSIADENIVEVMGAVGILKRVIVTLNWKLET